VLEPVHGRERLRCGMCGFVLYQNPASAAAGVVLNACGEILLVRRAIEPFRDHWALPAGYQELDEGPEETVVREVREEAGIEVEVLGLLDLLFVRDDPRKPANVAVFLCRARGGEPCSGREENGAGWFRLDALPQPIGFDNYARILARLVQADGYPESPWARLRRLLARPDSER
jgi:mutator protein MutT